MYKTLIVLILALAAIGCRSKKETVQTSASSQKSDSAKVVSLKSDSAGQSFKERLTTSTFKQADVKFTTWEYEYPEQTADEKKSGIEPKPRIKSKTEGVISQSETSKQNAQASGNNSQVKKQEIDKTNVKKQADTKATFKKLEVKSGGSLWLIIIPVIVAGGAYLVWKYSLINRIKALFTPNK